MLGWEHHPCYQLTSISGGLSSQCASRWFLNVFTVPLLTTSWGSAFQVVVMLMGKKCCATDVASLLIFFHYFGSYRSSQVKEAYWTNIVQSVQVFEHLNKLPSKSPLYEANEFQILKPLLVSMVSDLGDHFCSSSLCSFHFIYVST